MVIADLIPHAGAMVLLDDIVSWDDATITCRTTTHLDVANPLRRAGRLSTICAVEYALQAAALHGALRDGVPQRQGYVARLRDVALQASRLDDPAFGPLSVHATLDHAEPTGTLYTLRVTSEAGRPIATATAAIALPLPPGDGRGQGSTPLQVQP